MGTSDPDTSKGQRRRQLSIIYFVDAARTRTLTIPLGRLRLLLIGLGGLIAWGVASLLLTFQLMHQKTLLAKRLTTALGSIFEYETRDDHVFDIAYPSTKNVPTPMAPSVAALAAAKPPEPKLPVAAANAANEPVLGQVAAAERTHEQVSIGHPEVKMSDTTLDLSFDLTSKSPRDRVEGLIYAVAEFTPDHGNRVFIAAPKEIELQADGDAVDPRRAVLFGIRRFKQKRFQFPLVKDQTGVFKRVRIVVLDRSGAHKNVYDIPLAERVGHGHEQEQSRVLPPSAPKPG